MTDKGMSRDTDLRHGDHCNNTSERQNVSVEHFQDLYSIVIPRQTFTAIMFSSGMFLCPKTTSRKINKSPVRQMLKQILAEPGSSRRVAQKGRMKKYLSGVITLEQALPQAQFCVQTFSVPSDPAIHITFVSLCPSSV